MIAPDTAAGRLLVGALLAGAFALAARHARALSGSGVAAATLSGAVATAAGWTWAALLIGYFVATSALSRLGSRRKAARTQDIVAKGAARDWRQVAANGGVFSVAAVFAVAYGPTTAVQALAAGSLAAAAADSWGTEIGTLSRGAPRSILTFRPVATGASGGITVAGSLATVAGAAFVAVLAVALGWPHDVAIAAAIGGVIGAFSDSVIGAALQVRRHCPACGIGTEHVIHRCGTPTRVVGGVAWLDNDAVNLACALTGGVMAVLLAQ